MERKTVKCLNCEGPMIEHMISGVAIDFCSKCEALWFDSGEVEAVFRKKYGDRLEEIPTDVHFRLYGPVADQRCPRCGVASLRAGSLKTVPFKACGSCSGVFITMQHLQLLAISPHPSTELFDVGRYDPVDVLLETIILGPTGAMLLHMRRRIAETIGEEIR
jgi:Zn-finger nucleic acid-binding protein